MRHKRATFGGYHGGLGVRLNPVGEELHQRPSHFGFVTVKQINCFRKHKIKNTELFILRHADGKRPLA